jgi:hypothetical protein
MRSIIRVTHIKPIQPKLDNFYAQSSPKNTWKLAKRKRSGDFEDKVKKYSKNIEVGVRPVTIKNLRNGWGA